MTNESDSKQYSLGYGGAQNAMAIRSAATHAGFFLPHLKPGMKLLDCGCGPGTITLGLAEVINPGEVIGVDIEQSQVDAAWESAKGSGADNAKFQVASVYELPFSNESFDAVFTNALLEHLDKPLDALAEMKRVLKPGGVVGVKSPCGNGIIINPPIQLLEEFFELYRGIVSHNGGDPNRGARLRSLLVQSGFVNTEASASYRNYGTHEATKAHSEVFAKLMASEDYTVRMVELGWITRERVNEIVRALKDWGTSDEAFCAVPWGDAVGWKE